MEALEAAAQVVAVIKEREETIVQVAMVVEAKEEMIATVTLEVEEVEVVMEILDQESRSSEASEVVSLKVAISLNLVENVVENLNQIPVVLAVGEEEGIKYIL